MISPAELERRYRRLLWAYPGPYRRRYGAEIITTLLEMAESGHGRPSAAHTLHLVACGVRQRFRLPAGRSLAVVAAVLAAIALGALGTAGGTWLGWQTAASMPSTDQMRSLTASISGRNPSEVSVDTYQSAINGPAAVTLVSTTGQGSNPAGHVRTGLTSAGWRITAFTDEPFRIVVMTKDPSVTVPAREEPSRHVLNIKDFPTVPAQTIRFTATKDGLTLRGHSQTVSGSAAYDVDGSINQRMDIWAVETAAVRPLTIAGLLVGMIAGWLLTAALANRGRTSNRPHRMAVTALTVTAFAAAPVPCFDLYRTMYEVVVYDSGAPVPYIIVQPSEEIPTSLIGACAGIVTIALAAIVLIAMRRDRIGTDHIRQEPVAPN